MTPIFNDQINAEVATLVDAILNSSNHVKVTYRTDTVESVMRNFKRIETGYLQSPHYWVEPANKIADFIERTNNGDVIIDLLKEFFGQDKPSVDIKQCLSDIRIIHDALLKVIPAVPFFTDIEKVAKEHGFSLPSKQGPSKYSTTDNALKSVLARAVRLLNLHLKTKEHAKYLKDIIRICWANPDVQKPAVERLFGETVLKALEEKPANERFGLFIELILKRNKDHCEGTKVMLNKMKELHNSKGYIHFTGTSHLLGKAVKCKDSARDHVLYLESKLSSFENLDDIKSEILSFVHRSPYQKEICEWFIPASYRYNFDDLDPYVRGKTFEHILALQLLKSEQPTTGYDAHQDRDPKPEPVKKWNINETAASNSADEDRCTDPDCKVCNGPNPSHTTTFSDLLNYWLKYITTLSNQKEKTNPVQENIPFDNLMSIFPSSLLSGTKCTDSNCPVHGDQKLKQNIVDLLGGNTPTQKENVVFLNLDLNLDEDRKQSKSVFDLMDELVRNRTKQDRPQTVIKDEITHNDIRYTINYASDTKVIYFGITSRGELSQYGGVKADNPKQALRKINAFKWGILMKGDIRYGYREAIKA